jgi:FtsZ-binding cell division protein ZapB
LRQTLTVLLWICILLALSSCDDQPSLAVENDNEVFQQHQLEIEVMKEKIDELNKHVDDAMNQITSLTQQLETQTENLRGLAERSCAYLPIESTQSSNTFDPREIKIGDIIAGFMVTSVELMDAPNGELMAVVITFCDQEITVSGTYEIMDNNADFFNGVIFQLDEKSSKQIPVMDIDAENNTLLFRSDQAKNLLFPHGTKGKATIKVAGYSIHWWPKDDIRDNTTFIELIKINE